MDGVLSVDKPRNVSSQQAVTRVKRALGAKKAGHAGTLDPDATGLLLICLGRATRLFDAMQTLEKEYVATVTLGVETDTYDAVGEVVAVRDLPTLTSEELERKLDGYRGTIQQVPPPYSALKHQGQPLYKWARRGIAVEKPPRTVTVHALEVLGVKPRGDVGWAQAPGWADLIVEEVRLRVVCTRGTYVRSLAYDLGRELGCGAHMSALERTRTGPFRVEGAIPLREVEADAEVAAQRVLTIETVREMLAAVQQDPSSGAPSTHGYQGTDGGSHL